MAVELYSFNVVVVFKETGIFYFDGFYASSDWSLEVTKRGVVCFSKGRLDLEKIDKINFRGRRLENNQNLRQNRAVSKLRSHAPRKKAG